MESKSPEQIRNSMAERPPCWIPSISPVLRSKSVQFLPKMLWPGVIYYTKASKTPPPSASTSSLRLQSHKQSTMLGRGGLNHLLENLWEKTYWEKEEKEKGFKEAKRDEEGNVLNKSGLWSILNTFAAPSILHSTLHGHTLSKTEEVTESLQVLVFSSVKW